MNDKILSLMGIARRAGKVQAGFEAAVEAITARKAKAVFVAADIAPRTLKELNFVSKQTVPIIQVSYDMQSLTDAIGTKTGIVTVTDDGFANRLQELISSQKEKNICQH